MIFASVQNLPKENGDYEKAFESHADIFAFLDFLKVQLGASADLSVLDQRIY